MKAFELAFIIFMNLGIFVITVVTLVKFFYDIKKVQHWRKQWAMLNSFIKSLEVLNYEGDIWGSIYGTELFDDMLYYYKFRRM